MGCWELCVREWVAVKVPNEKWREMGEGRGGERGKRIARRFAWCGVVGCFLLGVWLVGCKKEEAMKEVDAYKRALVEKRGEDAPFGSEKEKRNVARFARFFQDVTEESVRSLIRETYAPRLYFFDTLVRIETVEELERYFVATARNAEWIRVEVKDVARSGEEYYVRWEMGMRLKAVKAGQELRSVGMSHLRFDAEGRIVLQHDFWDSAAGFYEHVPVLGAGIRWLRARIHGRE
ncbi:MAG: nuclear transport factor 2 family protein [Chthoniobacterales bacterium]|nr:nuclear transport factor 2 family protein [Chthoniobacterales bacterium]